MEYIASISYGKDSLAMLEVIYQNNLPLDRIVHVEIMATKDIPADLPPMMEFKAKADAIIYEKYGIKVEHITAPTTMRTGSIISVKERKAETQERYMGFRYRKVIGAIPGSNNPCLKRYRKMPLCISA